MNEQLRDQISAFLDSELSGEESELLVRRLGREDRAHEVARRYLLIGQALRGEQVGGAADAFHRRVVLALDEAEGGAGELPVETAALVTPAVRPGARAFGGGWRRALAGVGAAAAVAFGGVVVLQMLSQTGAGSGEQGAAYTVPVADSDNVPDLRSGMPPIRLTNYLMSHGEYAGSLGRKSVQSGIVGTSAARAMGGYFEMEAEDRDE